MDTEFLEELYKNMPIDPMGNRDGISQAPVILSQLIDEGQAVDPKTIPPEYRGYANHILMISIVTKYQIPPLKVTSSEINSGIDVETSKSSDGSSDLYWVVSKDGVPHDYLKKVSDEFSAMFTEDIKRLYPIFSEPEHIDPLINNYVASFTNFLKQSMVQCHFHGFIVPSRPYILFHRDTNGPLGIIIDKINQGIDVTDSQALKNLKTHAMGLYRIMDDAKNVLYSSPDAPNYSIILYQNLEKYKSQDSQKRQMSAHDAKRIQHYKTLSKVRGVFATVFGIASIVMGSILFKQCKTDKAKQELQSFSPVPSSIVYEALPDDVATSVNSTFDHVKKTPSKPCRQGSNIVTALRVKGVNSASL